jgi:putative two-component system response regulator
MVLRHVLAGAASRRPTAALRPDSGRVISALSNAVALRDDLTSGRGLKAHEQGVARLAALVADAMGWRIRRVEMIGRAAAVHDVGKLAIPDAILLKPGGLSPDEWAVVRGHPVLGFNILNVPDDPLMAMAARIAREHHESFDGSGYPYGIRGEAICPEARVVAVCDVYDALRSDRPYKRGLSHEEVMRVITMGDERTSPARFDPAVLAAALGASSRMEELWEAWRASAPPA